VKRLLSDVAYDQLRDMVLVGRLSPGEPLSEAAISAAIGMSRSPIRTALEKLVGVGLVQRVPGKGYFVSTISIATVTSVMEVREALEGFAAAHGLYDSKREVLKKLHWIFEHFATLTRDPTVKEWSLLAQADRRFHAEVVAGINNPIATQTVEQLSLSLGQVRSLAWSKTGRFRIGACEHVNIIDALLESNGALAQSLIEQHISSAKALLIELMSTRTSPDQMRSGFVSRNLRLDEWLSMDSAEPALMEEFMSTALR